MSTSPASAMETFRPHRARLVSFVLIPLVVAGGVVLALFAAGPFVLVDRAGFVLVALAIAEFLRRQAAVAAVPSREGLLVRNLAGRHRLEWAQIVEVRFGGGRPWVQLDLADGEVLAVMAVQRADGDRAVAESRRMATLVVRYSPVPPAQP